MTVIPAIADVYRDFETSGVPASGAHQPIKSEIRAALTDMQNNIAAAIATTALIYSSRASLYSDLAHDDKTRAEVRGDATVAYNGIYAKSGDSGSGSWSRIADLPDDMVRLLVTGGTANAITAAPSPQLPVTKSNKLYLLRPTATNTGAVTIDDGSGAVAIKTVFGNDLAANALLIDTENVLCWSVDHYQLLISASVDASSILADAQAAAVTATNAAATIDLPAISASSILGDNDAGTARVALTPAEVRTRIQVPSYDDLPYIDAANAGVSGSDGSDQTSAIQALISAFDSTGGNIVLPPGTINITTLDFSETSKVRLLGRGRAQAPNTPATTLQTDSTADRVLDCRGTVAFALEQLHFKQTNTSAAGKMFDFGRGPVHSSDSVYMRIRDCLINNLGTDTSIGIGLDGSTRGTFQDLAMNGKGYLVSGAEHSGFGIANVMSFKNVTFNPTGSQWPVHNPSDAWTFIQSVFENSSGDGGGRGILCDDNVPFRGLNLLGCWFGDVALAGLIWNYFRTGSGLNIQGCFAGGYTTGGGYYFAQLGGGAATGDPGTSGLRGVSIFGNTFDTFTAALTFAGSRSDGTNARGIAVGGNSITNGAMYSSLSSTDEFVGLPNFVYGSTDDAGAGLNLLGLPTSAGSLATGRIWSNSGVLTMAG
jgi:hypothetical protein